VGLHKRGKNSKKKWGGLKGRATRVRLKRKVMYPPSKSGQSQKKAVSKLGGSETTRERGGGKAARHPTEKERGTKKCCQPQRKEEANPVFARAAMLLRNKRERKEKWLC